MNTNEFRAEVMKIMPGYEWTIQRPFTKDGTFLRATGIQSAGFNRMSTLEIERSVNDDATVVYEASIAGYGTKGPWVESSKSRTLARALRHLQEQCSAMMRLHNACVGALILGRKGKAGDE